MGVTDLAGNIQTPSQISFNVATVDPGSGTVTPATKPAILGVKQVADNIFQVETNEANVSGKFTIENADGENGVLDAYLPLSKADPSDATKFYSYVTVAAVDNETGSAVNDKNDNVLAYDGQDYINRHIKVSSVILDDTSTNKVAAIGDTKDFGTVTIQKDINAPIVVHPTTSIAYSATNKKLTINVNDVVPNGTNGKYVNPVDAVKYAYNSSTKVLDTATVDMTTSDSAGSERYLPIKVSYVDVNGATHVATLSNIELKSLGGTATDVGAQPSTIDYDKATGILTLDLEHYGDLLNSDQTAIVDGTNYSVQIPKGFFGDPAHTTSTTVPSASTITTNFITATGASDKTVTFTTTTVGDTVTLGAANSQSYEVLYVSDARQTNNGYTSTADTISLATAAKPTSGTVTSDAVPQTSKKLITYNKVKNEMSVEFTGSIDVNTLKNPANYTLNGKTLSDWGMTSSDITYVYDNNGTADTTDDHQYARFTIPSGSVAADGDVAFSVANVANKLGGKMTQVDTQVALLDNTKPIAIQQTVSGQRQLVLLFDEPIQYKAGLDKIAAAKNFKVMCGSTQLTVLDATIDSSNRQLTLNLGTDIPTTYNVTIQVVPDTNNDILIQDMSENHNVLDSSKIYTITR